MGSEQRQYPRAGSPFSCQYRRAGDFMALWQSGTILDLSAGGFRFTSQEMVEEGARLEFEIRLPVRAESYVFVAKVVWTKGGVGDVKEYGVSLLDIGPDKQAEIDELVRFLLKRYGKTENPDAG